MDSTAVVSRAPSPSGAPPVTVKRVKRRIMPEPHCVTYVMLRALPPITAAVAPRVLVRPYKQKPGSTRKPFSRKPFDAEENTVLRLDYTRLPAVEIAARLGRTVGSVRHQAGVLGLNRPLRRWSVKEDDQVRGAHRVERIRDVATRLGRHPSEVYHRAQTLGLGSWRVPGPSYSNGYLVREWVEDGRGRRNAYLEHRAVVAEAMGRPLRSDEIVHHINGDRLDNRLANLYLTDRSGHRTAHFSIEGLMPALWQRGLISFDRERGVYFLV
jgi:hypothetical protein